MKTNTFLILPLAFILMTIAAFGQGSKVIYDPLRNTIEKNYTDADEQIAKTKVLPKIQNRWSGETDCDGSNLNVISAVDGAFTKKGAAQRAIVYEMCQTGNGFANNGVAIIENGQIVSHFVTEGGWNINAAQVSDINRNGFDEIAIETSGGMHQGYSGSSLTVMEISAARVKSLGTFLIYTNECEGGPAEKYCDQSYKITARSGSAPAFTRQKYNSKSSNEKPKWVKSGRPQTAKPIAGVNFKYTQVK